MTTPARTRAAAAPAADGLASTDAERAALAALRDAAGATDGPIERHSVRVFLVMEWLAERASLEIDREVALCAALLHDVGLYSKAATGVRMYLNRGRRYAAGVLAPFGWSDDRLRRCLEAIERHHRVGSQWRSGVEVELLRAADLVDATGGLVRFGLRAADLRRLERRIPRAGLYGELARRAAVGLPCVARALPAAVIHAVAGDLRPPRRVGA